MSVNVIPISGRTAPWDAKVTANGSYTLPQYAFIPHPSLQMISSGVVLGPQPAGVSASFVAPAQLQRSYPVPYQPSVYAVRSVQVKSSPG